MALIADLRVNNHYIGMVAAQRIKGGVGGPCTYSCYVRTHAHPTTHEPGINVEGILVEHHYNEDLWALIEKVLRAARPASDE